MNNFQNELQMLNVDDFQVNQAIPWDQSQYYVDQDQDRQFGAFFRCFSCFTCFNCFNCSNCFIALTALTALIAIVVVVIVVVVVVVIIVVEVDAAAVVVAVDKSSFRIENVVDYGEGPLYELQGLFFIRLDIRDKLRYIRL